MGHPGFETQMLVCLSGRVETARLYGALTRLCGLYAVLTAHLDERHKEGPRWEFQRRGACALRELDLPSAKMEAVLQTAAELLAAPTELAKDTPIRFVLLHRPDGRDVFLAQYNHTLMDNVAAPSLIQVIDRAFHQDIADLWTPVTSNHRDVIGSYLRRFPHERRRKASRHAIDLWSRTLRGRAITLGRAPPVPTRPAHFRIHTRCLEEVDLRKLQRTLSALGTVPSLSMAVLASVFRAISRQTYSQDAKRGQFVAGIGVDLGLRGRKDLTLQNLMSLVPVRAGPEELDDRVALVRMLNRQFRERLEQDVDLGVLRTISLFGRRPRQARWGLDLFLRYGFSLWYAYFGNTPVSNQFCDVEIENVFFTSPAWWPNGMTLLVNQFRGRLLFQTTTLPEIIPDSLAGEFLDQLIADLLA
jgi:hypothetical protein